MVLRFLNIAVDRFSGGGSGIFFTSKRVLYVLESPKKTSVKKVYGVLLNSEIENLTCKKTMTDGIDFMVNGQKIGHIAKIGEASDLEKIGRLFQVTLNFMKL